MCAGCCIKGAGGHEGVSERAISLKGPLTRSGNIELTSTLHSLNAEDSVCQGITLLRIVERVQIANRMFTLLTGKLSKRERMTLQAGMSARDVANGDTEYVATCLNERHCFWWLPPPR